MSRWKRTTPQTQAERLAQFHARLKGEERVDDEELLRRQAVGIPVRERMVRRAFSIPRHRSLVVIPKTKVQRRRKVS